MRNDDYKRREFLEYTAAGTGTALLTGPKFNGLQTESERKNRRNRAGGGVANVNALESQTESSSISYGETKTGELTASDAPFPHSDEIAYPADEYVFEGSKGDEIDVQVESNQLDEVYVVVSETAELWSGIGPIRISEYSHYSYFDVLTTSGTYSAWIIGDSQDVSGTYSVSLIHRGSNHSFESEQTDKQLEERLSTGDSRVETYSYKGETWQWNSYLDQYALKLNEGDTVRVSVTSDTFEPKVFLTGVEDSKDPLIVTDSSRAEVEYTADRTGWFDLTVTSVESNVTGRYALSLRVGDEQTAPQIRDLDVNEGSYRQGDTVTADVTVYNPRSSEQEFFVGFTVYDENGNSYDNDGSTGHMISVGANSEKTTTVEWNVEANAPSGSYDALVALWEEASRENLQTRLDTAEGSFTVEERRISVECGENKAGLAGPYVLDVIPKAVSQHHAFVTVTIEPGGGNYERIEPIIVTPVDSAVRIRKLSPVAGYVPLVEKYGPDAFQITLTLGSITTGVPIDTAVNVGQTLMEEAGRRLSDSELSDAQAEIDLSEFGEREPTREQPVVYLIWLESSRPIGNWGTVNDIWSVTYKYKWAPQPGGTDAEFPETTVGVCVDIPTEEY